jgi:hypothetical protein
VSFKTNGMYTHAEYNSISVAELNCKKQYEAKVSLRERDTDANILCNQQFQTVEAWIDCDGQWLHRVGTTRNLFVGKRCISSVNRWQQLLSRVRCGNLLALQRRTCGGRTRVPAQSVSATFHPSGQTQSRMLYE